MSDIQYKLKPLQETQVIPVHWEFSHADYDKLVKGHRSNWCIFLQDSTVHICRIGGEEFYRFSVRKIRGGACVVEELETYALDQTFLLLKYPEQMKEEVRQDQIRFRQFAVEEVTGLLKAYCGISC